MNGPHPAGSLHICGALTLPSSTVGYPDTERQSAQGLRNFVLTFSDLEARRVGSRVIISSSNDSPTTPSSKLPIIESSTSRSSSPDKSACERSGREHPPSSPLPPLRRAQCHHQVAALPLHLSFSTRCLRAWPASVRLAAFLPVLCLPIIEGVPFLYVIVRLS